LLTIARAVALFTLAAAYACLGAEAAADSVYWAGAALSATNAGERTLACAQLDRMGAEALLAVPLLIARLGDDPAGDWRTTEAPAVMALDAIGDPAVESLLGALRSTNAVARAAAARALGRIKHPQALRHIAVLLADPEVNVYRSAAWALARLEHEAAIEPLTAALAHADEQVREYVAWGLSEIGGSRVLDALAQAMKDESPAVRRAASKGLGGISNTTAQETLAAALNDSDADVRRAAEEAVAYLKRKAQRRAAAGNGRHEERQ